MQSEAQTISSSDGAATESAGEPYRYDERGTSTGSAQADLAPVSPEPGPVSSEPPPQASEPSSSTDVDDPENPSPAPSSENARDAGSRADEDPSAGQEATPAASSVEATPTPSGSDHQEVREIDLGLHASPEATLYWQDFAGIEHQTTVSAQINLDASAVLRGETSNASASQPSSPSVPLPEPMTSAPSMGMPEVQSAFADMAARMDEMMADFMNRLGGDNDEAGDTGTAIGGPASWDGGDLAGSLDDFRSAADSFLSDLETPFDQGSSGGLLGQLFSPDSEAASPFSGAPEIDDLISSDDGVTELLSSLDDDNGLLAGLGFEGSSESLWDHFNDFG